MKKISEIFDKIVVSVIASMITSTILFLINNNTGFWNYVLIGLVTGILCYICVLIIEFGYKKISKKIYQKKMIPELKEYLEFALKYNKNINEYSHTRNSPYFGFLITNAVLISTQMKETGYKNCDSIFLNLSQSLRGDVFNDYLGMVVTLVTGYISHLKNLIKKFS
jgi:hypothetical protein